MAALAVAGWIAAATPSPSSIVVTSDDPDLAAATARSLAIQFPQAQVVDAQSEDDLVRVTVERLNGREIRITVRRGPGQSSRVLALPEGADPLAVAEAVALSVPVLIPQAARSPARSAPTPRMPPPVPPPPVEAQPARPAPVAPPVEAKPALSPSDISASARPGAALSVGLFALAQPEAAWPIGLQVGAEAAVAEWFSVRLRAGVAASADRASEGASLFAPVGADVGKRWELPRGAVRAFGSGELILRFRRGQLDAIPAGGGGLGAEVGAGALTLGLEAGVLALWNPPASPAEAGGWAPAARISVTLCWR